MDYEVEADDTEETAAKLANANIDLVTGKRNVTLLNETVTATSIEVNNIIGKLKKQ